MRFELEFVSHRLVLQVQPLKTCRKDLRIYPRVQHNRPSCTINNSKGQSVWYMRVKCSLLPPPESIFWQYVWRGWHPEGLRHVKCSFMFCKGSTSSSISHPWNGELRGRSHCAGTVCSDRLTNLTTDWLWKWLSLVPLAPLSLSEASVAFSFFFLLCAFSSLFIPTHSHLPQQKTKV